MRALVLALGVALTAALAAPGCAFSSAVAFGPVGAARDPSQIPVFAADHLDRPYDVVGLVVTQIDASDPHELLHELRHLAAALGADAVIGMQLELGMGIWNVGRHLSGTAVRYR
jgi:hypothetical protein